MTGYNNINESEIKRWQDEAEIHAFSVRQLIAQRTRLFAVIQLIGRVADFRGRSDVVSHNDASLAQVLNVIEKTQSQFMQDVLSLLFSGGKRNGYFVEFGACDGEIISNTLLLERDFGWSGILSEPSRYWSDRINSNRKCIIEKRCVWSKTGEMIEFAELENDSYNTESGILDFIDKEKNSAITYQVETVSLFDMLRQNGAPKHIDFISIDTEGSELNILEAFPFREYTFGFIAVEHKLDWQRDGIMKLMKKSGYIQILSDISDNDGFYVPMETAESLFL